MDHTDKLKTSAANKAYRDGLSGIDWSKGREGIDARQAEREAAKYADTRSGVQIVGDIEPFLSPLDFKTPVGGRRQRKEFMRRHGLAEVGNEKNFANERPKMGSVAEDIKKAYQQTR